MAYCRSTFVPFLPQPWRNLETLDHQIIDDFKKDYSSILYFVEHLERMRQSTGWESYLPSADPFWSNSCFAEKHATLCRSAMRLLTTDDQQKYNALKTLIESSNNKQSSYSFFSAYDWHGLPIKWRGPDYQESLMIEYLEKEENESDVKLFLKGLNEHEHEYSYPRASLVAAVIGFMKNWCDKQLLRRIQSSARSLVRCDVYNGIMVRHGCLQGLLACVGWLCEDDPRLQVMHTNMKMQKIRNDKSLSISLAQSLLNKQRDVLRDLARPWRLSRRVENNRLHRTINVNTNNVKSFLESDDKILEPYYIFVGHDKELSIDFIDKLHIISLTEPNLCLYGGDVDEKGIKVLCNASTAQRLSLLCSCSVIKLSSDPHDK